MRPRLTDALSAGVGLGIFAIAAMLCGIGRRSYSKPGAALPFVGTDACGLPRKAMVSDAVSHGSIFGCCLKSVNQLHAQIESSGATRAVRQIVRPVGRRITLSLTPHLRRTMLLEHSHRLVGAIRIGHHPDAELSAAEPRVVPDGGGEPGDMRHREHREHRRQAPDQYHHLEAE